MTGMLTMPGISEIKAVVYTMRPRQEMSHKLLMNRAGTHVH